MYTYFTHKQTYKYKDVLQDLVSHYNNSPYSSPLGRIPVSITQHKPMFLKKMYIDSLKPKTIIKKVRKSVLKPRTFKFKVGDHVRLSHIRHPFSMGYQEKWTEEVFIIRERFRWNNNPIYKVKDWDGEKVKGTCDEPELQKINKDNDNLWRKESVFKKRKRGGRTELYVKWMGLQNYFSSWVS